MFRSRMSAALLWGVALAPLPVAAQNLGVELVAQGFVLPTFVTAPQGDDRIFVTDIPGQVWVIGPDGSSELFLDIGDQLLFENAIGYSPTGLVGLAFHPDYLTNGRLFVRYNDNANVGHIVEFRVSSDPNRADASSGVSILSFEQINNYHSGGWIGFGPDGYMYITTGDSSFANDGALQAQDTSSLLGKILRIDVDGNRPYEIPQSNPFASGGGAPEVFAYGLRNPWRASFDGGNLYIGDVGQKNAEEINLLTTADAGANFGWSIMEGTFCYRLSCDRTGLTMPIYEYSHRTALGGPPGPELLCDSSITGGYVYRGRALPELFGHYVYADFCTGAVRSIRLTDTGAFDPMSLSDEIGHFGGLISFGIDGAGELYFTVSEGLDEGLGFDVGVGGLVFRIVPR